MVAAAPALVLETEHGHGVVQLTLNRPEVMNALNERLYYATAAALRRHTLRAATRIVVLTGAGQRSFCSGMDIKEVSETAQGKRTVRAARAFMDALMLCHKPVVAAVFGRVTGIGVTLLLHCDVVYSARDGSFETPFSAIGIVPEFGSSVLFPLFLGLRFSAALLLRGETVGAGEMERVGVVEVVQKEGRDGVVGVAVERAVEWSARIGKEEQWEAVVEAKRVMREPIRKQVRAALRVEFVAIDRQIASGTAARLMRNRVAEMARRNSKL